MAVPEIFDRNARRTQRGRTKGGGFFAETMVADLLDRLDSVQRTFEHILVIGAEPLLIDGLRVRGLHPTICDPAPREAALIRDEDQLGFAGGQFDLVLATGTLDTVADLPGALLLIRRALRPDGLLLANFAGAPSLTALRDAIATADAENGLAVARLHPLVDVRSGGDLLVRAGFALPVADLDTIDVAYSGFARLLADLRAAASTNMLADRYPVTRQWVASVDRAFAAMARDTGHTHETLSFITLTGWAPSDTQPRPARRGSATASLKDALAPRPPAPK